MLEVPHPMKFRWSIWKAHLATQKLYSCLWHMEIKMVALQGGGYVLRALP